MLPEVEHMRSIGFIRKFLIAAAVSLIPMGAFAAVFISVGIAPPALPIYTQPLCPGAGYIWTPGYWAYGQDGYYWVPGVWVQPPAVGLLWTPGYWGWGGSAYIFHAGYWGPHVGFYGGVHYGFGYTGYGYEGGYWNHGVFAYNRAVNNIDIVHIHNVYSRPVVVNHYSRVSYNGGHGGLAVRATPREEAAFHEQHAEATSMQMSHREAASRDRTQYASFNHGRPQTMAMSRVGERANNQQQRIGQGVRSGQMTASETRNVENREASINRETRNDREANGGRLTGQERQQINQRQNNVSRSINNDKHNARMQEHPRGHEDKR